MTKSGIERDLSVSPYIKKGYVNINDEAVEIELRFTSQYNIPKYETMLGRYSTELPLIVSKKLNVKTSLPIFLVYLKAYLESERRGFWIRVGDKVYTALDDIKVRLVIERL